jgi:hypothetical protein
MIGKTAYWRRILAASMQARRVEAHEVHTWAFSQALLERLQGFVASSGP